MSMFERNNDIRDGLKIDLRLKVKEQKLARYLLSIRFQRLRSLLDQKITFDYPITAIIGPNGGGKSTVLGAAACAYLDIKPSLFFAKAHIGDDAMQDWRADYELIDKALKTEGTLTRNAKFHNKKWVRDNAPKRFVSYFGITRTVPASEQTIFRTIAKKGFSPIGGLSNISTDVAEKVARILGRPVERYKFGQINQKHKFFVGQNTIGQFSELHFGAGEASVLRMVTSLESSEDSSLVLIEEIENGLHPVAVSKMIEYLFDLVSRKKVQVIFTTHSDVAIDPLPSEAVWASVDGALQQGKLSVEATRAISGRVDRKVSVFVEDEFAKLWTEMVLARHLLEDARQVGVYALSGESTAIAVHNAHMNNPAVETKPICVLDGDSSYQENLGNGVIKLPGNQPESFIFHFCLDRLDSAAAILCAMCHFDENRQSEFIEKVKSIALKTSDPHLYFSKLGIELGFISELVIKRAFISFWLRTDTESAVRIADYVKKSI